MCGNGSVRSAEMVAYVIVPDAVSFMPGSYVRRVIDTELDELFLQLPAIVLDGPKGVGKTATAEQRCSSIRRLDVAGQRAVLEADPSLVGQDPKPVLIDEWQRLPAVWDAVRRLVDQDHTGGQYLLTGSAPLASTHSGSARIVDLRMRPLCLGERHVAQPTVSFSALAGGTAATLSGSTTFALTDYVDEIIAGGFPGLRHLTGRALTAQLDSYVERLASHDLPDVGFSPRRPGTLMAWLRAYAAATATTATWETLRNAATAGIGNKPAKTTTSEYGELLGELRVLDPLEAWIPSRNHLGRLASAGKHHLCDPALAVRLLGRTKRHLLSANDDVKFVLPNDGTLLGNLFESLVALSVRTYAQAIGGATYHLRTEAGRHEVDFIVETDNGVLAVEVKLSGNVDDDDVRHLIWLREQLGDNFIDGIVITTGTDAYRRRDGIGVIPLALLGESH